MNLKLMYITNDENIAQIAVESGVNRIFVDLETYGKENRQKGLDTVKSHHSYQDIKKMRSILDENKLLVRCNPIHEPNFFYDGSLVEINKIVDLGADIIMLPYFKTYQEVECFFNIINGRVKTCLLFETKESINLIDDICKNFKIDEAYIGLNDLSISLKKDFMFELLSDGTVDKIVTKFKEYKLDFGFGGIANIGGGLIPAEDILIEHYRLGSKSVILSRSFIKNCTEDISRYFKTEVNLIRSVEKKIADNMDCNTFKEKHLELKKKIDMVIHK